MNGSNLDVDRFEQPKDARLWRFLSLAVELLDGSGLGWAAFGSCAVFAHRGRLQRLTRDLDVCLRRDDLDRLDAAARRAGLETARQRQTFLRIKHDIYQVHAVSASYTLCDYRDGERLAPIHAVIDWHSVPVRELRFPTDLPALRLRVAPLETVACISMLRTLNANSIDDVSGLLSHPAFDPAAAGRFATQNPPLRPLLVEQIERLSRLEREGRFEVASAADFRRNVPLLLAELRRCLD